MTKQKSISSTKNAPKSKGVAPKKTIVRKVSKPAAKESLFSATKKKVGELVDSITTSTTSGYETLGKLFEHELADLYSAEHQLIKALPDMAEKASDPKLANGFRKHLKETETHARRLEQIAKELKLDLSGVTCKAMEGLIKEGKEVLSSKGPPAIIDAALIGAAQRVEHYEMAGYGCVKAIATQLGYESVAALLQTTLDEEGAADKALTNVAESSVLADAQTARAA